MRFRHLAALTVASALVLSAPAYVGQAAAEEATAPEQPAVEQVAAEQALEAVQAIVDPQTTTSTSGSTGKADLTLALNDLRQRMADLSPADRRLAKHYFTRPDGVASAVAPYDPDALIHHQCDVNVCVHWDANVTNTDFATDAQAAATLAVAQDAWNRIVTQSGYAAPRTDVLSASNGANMEDPSGGKLDFYLADTGGENQGLFGMCTTDDPTAFGNPPALRFSAYCAVDNAFDNWGGVPLDLMRVTVAHEFFHAVQFAYDGAEDKWLMEGTAAWIEDELYDSINDNVNYIHPSVRANPLTKPHVPVDRWDDGWRNYGVWTFWKKLTERYPAKQGVLPKIMLDVWKKAAGLKRGGASTMALESALEARGTSFGSFFAKWGVGNRIPRKAYSEGAALHYPKAPLEGGFGLSKRKRSIGWQTDRLNHMTNAHYRFNPKGLSGKRWRLRVQVDAPDKERGSYATLVVHKRSGAIKQVRIKLNKRGDGAQRVIFGKGSVKRVELTLTNGSLRFQKCYSHGFSEIPLVTCMGDARDDRQAFRFRARVSR